MADGNLGNHHRLLSPRSPQPPAPPGWSPLRRGAPASSPVPFATATTSFRTHFLAVLVFLVLLLPAPSSSGVVLNEFVRHFEPLFYDHVDVHRQHRRAKRDATGQLYTHFTAHNRLFKVRLRRSSAVFADDVLFENTQGPIDFPTHNVYEGELEDDSQSKVDAVLTSDGYLDATIATASEEYHIEPASRYFGARSNLSFPAVIYRGSDVRQPDSDAHCASHELHLKHWERRWISAKPKLNQSSTAVITPNDSSYNSYNNKCTATRHSPHCDDSPENRLMETDWSAGREGEIDRTLYSGWLREGARKRRRSTIDRKKTTCMLYLQSDHLLYQRLGSEKAAIETMTRHVQRVNAIYRNVDFDGDGESDEINFMIKRIKVHTDQALNDPSYRFPGNYGVEKFLELFSEEDYDAFCLAYMFTYRDFEGGTLGLAWTGDLKNAGGVCEKNGHYRGSLKSLNTGIVTLLNYGKHVPPAVSHVTLAHEIGHNFGSPHDPENNRECTPGGEDGNYIMFARATSGDKKNNNKFSPCSLKSINGVLNAKARDAKGCFTEPQNSICGNGVVEAGEECDCGWEEDCREDCCFPMRTNPSFNEKPCTLKPARTCSPSQGPCCTDDCHLRYDVKCRDDNGCRDAAYCDGSGPQCPPSLNKPNKTICNEEFVCFMGECRGSICIAYGLESCQCIPGPNDPPTKACELCCKLPGDDQVCRSSFEWNAPPYDVPDMHAKPGTPCNNYNGYCDVFQKCREVDPSGPLATLRRLLLSDESIASLKRWVQDHWYGVLFIAVGFVSLIVVVVRVFGKKANFTLRRRRRRSRTAAAVGGGAAAAAAANGAVVTAVPIAGESANGHIVHPVVVRSKIPLKTKVREKRSRHGKSSKSKPSRTIAFFHKKSKDDPGKGRSRRSGVVNTTEKVRTWLERENPLRQSLSDNESHFPSDDEKRVKQPTVPGTSAEEAKQAEKPTKMKRSISECPGSSKVEPLHRFGRSVSQIHESDYRKLAGKSDLKDLRSSSAEVNEKAGLGRIGSKVGLLDEVKDVEPKQAGQPPVVAQIPEPKRRMVKSSTEGKLHKTEKSSSKKSPAKSTSFELLSFVRKKLDEQTANPSRKAKVEKVRVKAKAVGLGPVRVVLKWHGPSRLKPLKRSSPTNKNPSKKPKIAKDKKSAQKRVIVYSNNTTAAAATSSSAAAAAAVETSPVEKLDTKPKLKAEDPPLTRKDQNHPRRYSMQERSASKPAKLMRHQSEIHPRKNSDPVEHISIEIDTDHASEC